MQDYPGIDGFLGTRASLMVDAVTLAMAIVLPVMGWAIYQVRFRRKFLLHKRVMVTLGALLFVAVGAFEIDIQYISRWRCRAEASAYYGDPWYDGAVGWALAIHLVFAISTALLWIYVIVQALRKIPNPPGPSPYSRTHIFWSRLAAIDMVLTTVTGWIFYVLAFAL